MLCKTFSHPRTYSISSFAFKMHPTTVANTFTHDARSNLFIIFLERRLKLDSLLFLSGWAGREDKLGFTISLSATEEMRRDIFCFRNSLWVCSPDVAIHSPWALTSRAAPQSGSLVTLHAGNGTQRTWWGSFGSTQTPRTWEVWAEQSDDLNCCFYNKKQKNVLLQQERGRGAAVKMLL